jgi:O-antigen ligase
MVTLIAALRTRGRQREDAGHAAASSIALVGVCALVLAVPFEATEPVLNLPGQVLSSAELVLLATLAAWAAACVHAGRLPVWRTLLTWPWAILLGTWLAAAALAPASPLNALHMSGRLALAFGVYLLTVNAVTSWAAVRTVMIAATGAGALLAAVVILDFLGIGAVRSWLAAFRPFVAHVGNQVRASGVFQYPTIASMYLEVLFALSLPVFASMVDRRRPAGLLLASIAIIAMTQAAVLTFTRAGVATMLAGLGVVVATRYRARRADRVVAWLSAVALVIVTQFAVSYSAESLLLRLTTEGTEAWYAAKIDAPARLEIPTGGTRPVKITLTNTGRVTWDSAQPQPFRLSYHWLTADGTRVVSWEGRRTKFSQPVASGRRVTLEAELEAPRQPGQYRVLWDLEHEGRLWFSTEPGAVLAVSMAVVTGPPIGAPPVLMPLPRTLQQEWSRPGRLALWWAGALMLADHPMTGVGPDNFRLQYGRYLGLADPDPRLHSNSLYIEVLAGTGLLGAAAFAFFFSRVAMEAWNALKLRRRGRPPIADDDPADAPLLTAGVVAGGLAIALHGLVDSFLSFTATYVLFAITLGLVVSLGSSCQRHAHRV